MIVCVNPQQEDFDENVHVMKFAEMASEVILTCLSTFFNIYVNIRVPVSCISFSNHLITP